MLGRVGRDHRMHENALANPRLCHFILARRGGAGGAKNKNDCTDLVHEVYHTAAVRPDRELAEVCPTAAFYDLPKAAEVVTTYQT